MEARGGYGLTPVRMHSTSQKFIARAFVFLGCRGSNRAFSPPTPSIKCKKTALWAAFLHLKCFDNNDTVSYGCIRVALELQPSEENATLMKRVRQIGICRSQSAFGTVIYTLKTKNTLRSVLSFPRIVRYIYIHRTYTLALSARYALACVAFYS